MIAIALAQLLAFVPATQELPQGVARLEAQGRYGEAARVLEASAPLDRDTAGAWRRRATAFRAALGDLDGVAANLDVLRRSGVDPSSLAPLLLDAVDDVGGAAPARGRARILEGCLCRNGWCRARGDRWRAWVLLGDVQRATGHTDRAERAYAAADRVAASWSERVRARAGLLAIGQARLMALTQPSYRGPPRRTAFDRWVVRVLSPWVQRLLREADTLSAMFSVPVESRASATSGPVAVEIAARLAEVGERACLAATQRVIPPDIAANPDLLDVYLTTRYVEGERHIPRGRRCGGGYGFCEFLAVRHRAPHPWLPWCAERRAAVDEPLSPVHDEIVPAARASD